jgi:hypothetical protein
VEFAFRLIFGTGFHDTSPFGYRFLLLVLSHANQNLSKENPPTLPRNT